ncbi:MAG: hypothetical protein K0Q95_3293 [Bacteroidota bacterium]|jgi:hypothetical protein|nr:hypothetical protein [Bacteroidota bacterium]
METLKSEYSHIKGWGIDNVSDDEPNYPIKTYTGDDHDRIRWKRPTLQRETVEILKSTERPTNSAVIGTTNPPRGLSGMIRRYAFKHSENEFKHWLPLLFADRIDVVEGIIEDLVHLKVPRLIKERGWYALAKHAPGLLARKIGVRLAVLVVGVGSLKLARR